MKFHRNNLRISPRNRVRRTRRGGTITSLVLVSGVVFIVYAAMAIDIGMVANRRQQLQSGCDAAALAACRELHDPSLLFPRGHKEGKEPSRNQASRGRELVVRAQDSAIGVARENEIGSQSIQLRRNDKNSESGDIVLGWVAEPADPTCEMYVWEDGSLLNSVEVQLGLHSPYRISLLAGKLLGVGETEISATARATLDQRVYGFRPAGKVAIPFAPILIDHGQWREQLTGKGLDDHYGVSESDGSVHRQSDGIPEVTFCLGKKGHRSKDDRSKDDKDNRKRCRAWLLQLASGASDRDNLARQFAQGLHSQDLEFCDGELRLGQRHLVTADSNGSAGPDLLAQIASALHRSAGKKMVWAVGNLAGKQADDERLQEAKIFDFVAARVVAVRVLPPSRIEVTVQPCLMTTATALVGPGAPHNGLIGKLMLSR